MVTFDLNTYLHSDIKKKILKIYFLFHAAKGNPKTLTYVNLSMTLFAYIYGLISTTKKSTFKDI
jgi:hypothetical protein